MTNTPSRLKLQDGFPAASFALLWAEFNILFPTEQHCLEEIYRRAAQELLKCRWCESQDIEKRLGDRVVRCRRCKKETWLTAGSFFHRMRSAKAWLAAIWLMERGVIVSSSGFHKLVGIAQSSALELFKKIATVIQSHMPEDGPANIKLLVSDFF